MINLETGLPYAKFDHSDTRIRQAQHVHQTSWRGVYVYLLGTGDYESAQLVKNANKTPSVKPGDVFSRLTVLSLARPTRWLCLCACGKKHEVADKNLKSGAVNSCGCLAKDVLVARSLKHGANRRSGQSPEYSVWCSMKSRCLDPNVPAYPRYGGRGVKVCERWVNSFINFLSDMGPRPTPERSLDRYPDPGGDYKPENCRWATRKEQNNNRRNSIYFEYQGEKLTVQQIAERFGHEWRYTYRRLFEYGLSPEAAMAELALPARRFPKHLKP